MIKPGEIQLKAREAGVRDQQIEKDYVLSWILMGIAQHPFLSQNIVFKGGTALKKIYFEDYRFSEDLDFTLLNNINRAQILEWFNEVFGFIREEARMELNIAESLVAEEGGETGINFTISYTGPLGGQTANKRVKVDISRTENLEFKPVMKNAIIGYSDLVGHQLLCYPLEEVLVEKMRTVMQRMQPRDYYDIWYLLEVEKMDVQFYVNEFKRKCVSKGIDPVDFHKKLQDRLTSYKSRWQNSMKDQIKDLPEFEQVQREVQRRLKNLEL